MNQQNKHRIKFNTIIIFFENIQHSLRVNIDLAGYFLVKTTYKFMMKLKTNVLFRSLGLLYQASHRIFQECTE